MKNTRIFARVGAKGNQVLIYQMALKTAQDVAMVLPVPVKPGSGDKAMSFFSFANYKKVFDDLHEGFQVQTFGRGPSDPFGSVPAGEARLEVVSVGAYDASYVPSIRDFGRLDERFRLPEHVWGKLPAYRDYGFAVFKLKAGNAQIHPMAFAFPTARPDELFFPTLHIHDGQIHATEQFDHTLYCQMNGQDTSLWEESPGIAVQFVKCGNTHGMVRADQHVYRRMLGGRMSNDDIVAKAKT